jgi:signal transduction histidine kinase
MLERVHGVPIDLQSDGAIDGTPERDLAVLRIAHEALQNALRHADPKHVALRLSAQDGELVVEVTDDGVGFEPDRAELRSRHLGLTSMEERSRELGGRLEIQSAPGAGTTVRLELTQ